MPVRVDDPPVDMSNSHTITSRSGGGVMYGISEEPAPPNPTGGPLELQARCYTDPAHRRGGAHPILLQPDWSVDTGHDLEAERFTVAFGGYLSCLHLEATV